MTEKKPPAAMRWIVGAVVVATVTIQTISMGPAIWGLNLILIIAFFVWAARPQLKPSVRESVQPVFLTGIVIQALHFGEEFWFGFPGEFPGVFGYTWSAMQFATVNLLYLAALVLAAVGLARGVAAADLPVWFFALVSVLNGVMHTGLALARDRYFPGLITAPLLFVVGLLIWKRLLAAEAAPDRVD
jgi:hypothetical protein